MIFNLCQFKFINEKSFNKLCNMFFNINQIDRQVLQININYC